MASTLVQLLLAGFATLLCATSAHAETHTIKFNNQCGRGTPQLLLGGKVVSTGKPYTSNGPIVAGIAYLQTGECGFNGEQCTLMEMTIQNPKCPGCGSSTDISLIAPHAFNVETSFSYYGGCDGQGAICSSGKCKSAFFKFDDNQVQVQCEANDVNLLITFCGDATKEANNVAGAPTIGSTSVAVTSSSSEPVKVAATSPSAATTPLETTPAAAASPKTSSPTAASSVPTSSTTPNRKSCRNARRSANDDAIDALLHRVEIEARALYNEHLQRRHKAVRHH